MRYHCSSNPMCGKSFWSVSFSFSPREEFPQTNTWDAQVARGPRGETGCHMSQPRDSPTSKKCMCRQWVLALFTSRGNSGDTGDLGRVIGPRLEVLKGEERGVMDTDGVCLDGLVDGFLEGFLLQLHEDAIRLLPFSLSLLCCLPPRKEEWLGGPKGPKEDYL